MTLSHPRHHKQLAVSRLVLFASSSGANRAMKRRAAPPTRVVLRSARHGFAPLSGEKWLSLIFRTHSKGRSDHAASPLFS